jgi:hypothetical protein
MQKSYEAPELMLVGEANDVILGFLGNGYDDNGQSAFNFEFQED